MKDIKTMRSDTAIRRKELRRWIILELDRKPPTLKQVMEKFGISIVTAHKDMVAYNRDLAEIDTSELDAAIVQKALEAVRLTQAEPLSMKELITMLPKKTEVKADVEGNMQVNWKTLEVIPPEVPEEEAEDQEDLSEAEVEKAEDIGV